MRVKKAPMFEWIFVNMIRFYVLMREKRRGVEELRNLNITQT